MKQLGIQYPLIQAPMAGGSTTPELVAAVSNAGGLGSLGAGYMAPNDLRKAIHAIRQLTQRPFAVNLFIPEPYQTNSEQLHVMQNILQTACHELVIKINPPQAPYLPNFDLQMRVIVEEKVPAFSFTFGLLASRWITCLKDKGIILLGTATHLEEAKLLEQLEIDVIVAQGSEAGGHRGTFIGEAEQTLIPVHTLVNQCINTLNTPIIAAGGIMMAQQVSDLLALGASGVQVGTAFLSCPESGAHPSYKKALLEAQHDHTILTRAFSGKLARGLCNTFIEKMQPYSKVLLDYPVQNALTQPMRQAAAQQNNIEFMSLWAGQGVASSLGLPATELVNQLMQKYSCT